MGGQLHELASVRFAGKDRPEVGHFDPDAEGSLGLGTLFKSAEDAGWDRVAAEVEILSSQIREGQSGWILRGR